MLWVRSRKNLTDALDVTPEFLRTKQHDAGERALLCSVYASLIPAIGLVVDYRNWHLGLGRRFRSLKVWFVLRRYGVEGFRKHIREVRSPAQLDIVNTALTSPLNRASS